MLSVTAAGSVLKCVALSLWPGLWIIIVVGLAMQASWITITHASYIDCSCLKSGAWQWGGGRHVQINFWCALNKPPLPDYLGQRLHCPRLLRNICTASGCFFFIPFFIYFSNISLGILSTCWRKMHVHLSRCHQVNECKNLWNPKI